MPERQLVRFIEGDKTAASFAFLQVLRRAYAVVDPDPVSIATSVRWYIENWIGAGEIDEPLKDELIDSIIRDVTLDSTAKQSRISLWTRGPRSVLLRTDGMAIIDTQGIIQMLGTLFVGLRHSEQERGMSFEESVRTQSINQRDKHLACLSSAFELAVQQWRWMEVNACKNLQRKRWRPADRNLTDEEYNAVRALAPPRVQQVMDLVVHTGRSQGEILNLRWSQLRSDWLVFDEGGRAEGNGRWR